MKPRTPLLFLAIAISLLCGATSTSAQWVAELRVADTEYRFLDANYTWKNGLVFDAFYVGVPGSNELNVGGGYPWKRGALTLTPLAYFVAGKEDGQRGIKTALLAAFEKGGWKALAFGGAYFGTAGATDDYQLLDTADFTRVIGGRWEIGVQEGFFRSGGSWNNQVGPLLKLNDARGAWAVSYRFGNEDEFRVGRLFFF